MTLYPRDGIAFPIIIATIFSTTLFEDRRDVLPVMKELTRALTEPDVRGSRIVVLSKLIDVVQDDAEQAHRFLQMDGVARVRFSLYASGDDSSGESAAKATNLWNPLCWGMPAGSQFNLRMRS